MSSQELEKLVEKIVLQVMQRIQSDKELSKFVKAEPAPEKNQWARTCSSYREEEKPAAPEAKADIKKQAVSTKKLYTENDILELAKNGQKTLVIAKKTIITPAARDAAKLKGIDIRTES
jgi:hypothetical protein